MHSEKDFRLLVDSTHAPSLCKIRFIFAEGGLSFATVRTVGAYRLLWHCVYVTLTDRQAISCLFGNPGRTATVVQNPIAFESPFRHFRADFTLSSFSWLKWCFLRGDREIISSKEGRPEGHFPLKEVFEGHFLRSSWTRRDNFMVGDSDTRSHRLSIGVELFQFYSFYWTTNLAAECCYFPCIPLFELVLHPRFWRANILKNFLSILRT